MSTTRRKKEKIELKKVNVHNLDKVMISLAPNADELEYVRTAKPKCVLISFGNRWGDKKANGEFKYSIQEDLIAEIGYRPETIVVDSGAFSFKDQPTGNGWLKLMYDEWVMELEQEIVLKMEEDEDFDEEEFREEYINNFDFSLLMEMYGHNCDLRDYLDFLDANCEFYDYCLVLDKMGDPEVSLFAYKLMDELGYPNIPVFHMGSDFSRLDEFVAAGADYIALGGSALSECGTRANDKINERAAWAKEAIDRHPNIKFHMLGTLSFRIADKAPGLYSMDGTSWLRTGRGNAFKAGVPRRVGVLEELRKIEFKHFLRTTPTGVEENFDINKYLN